MDVQGRDAIVCVCLQLDLSNGGVIERPDPSVFIERYNQTFRGFRGARNEYGGNNGYDD